MPVTDPADGYALALEEARRALDEQERAVAHLSTRAGMLLSTAAIVTSLLGGPVVARGALGIAAWAAIVAFVGLGATAISMLRPRRQLEFALHPIGLISAYLDPATCDTLPSDQLRRELAMHMGDSIDRNEEELTAMATSFNTASVLLAIEIVAWIVSIATGS